VVDFFSNNLAAITLVLAGLCLLTIVMLQALQVSKLRQRIDDLTGGVEGGDLEAVLGEHLETVHQVGRDLDELTARMAVLESSARHHFARQGLVRFNPFPDTGGNQSFALALLDESDDGYIVSSLHSRTGTRIYAKAVIGGKSDTSLSAEEQDAIDEARSKRAARPAAPPRSAAASRAVAAPSAVLAAAASAMPRTLPVAPAPAARPMPAVAALSPKSMPARAAAQSAKPAAPAGPAATAQEATNRAESEQAKGQEKSRDSAPESAAAPDSERVGFKPGRPPVSDPRTK
jgi:hypothetical protein